MSRLQSFALALERGYGEGGVATEGGYGIGLYHNAIHAADVVATTCFFLNIFKSEYAAQPPPFV